MAFEFWVAISALIVMILAWTSVLSSTGTAEAATLTGFTFRNLFQRTRFVHWDELCGPGDRFETFLPRIIVRRTNGSFFRIGRSYSILTSTTAPDVLALIEKRYGVRRPRLESYFK
jgi:hypothetical protein